MNLIVNYVSVKLMFLKGNLGCALVLEACRGDNSRSTWSLSRLAPYRAMLKIWRMYCLRQTKRRSWKGKQIEISLFPLDLCQQLSLFSSVQWEQ